MVNSPGKRGRVHDRLSDLPDCLLHGILSLLGSRQAVQTSALSRRWRHLWQDLPCVDIDEQESEHFEDFADHMLASIPPETQVDIFRLRLVRRKDGYATSAASWIRRGLQRVPATVDIRATDENAVDLGPGGSFFPVRISCTGAGSFTRRLTTLRLVQVWIVAGFLQNLGESCPVLEALCMERCAGYVYAVASPTLRSLSVVGPRSYGNEAGPLRLTAPRLTSMRLDEFAYDGWRYLCYVKDGAPDPEPLPSLAEASIRLTGLDDYQETRPQRQVRMLEFLESMCNFVALLPNVANLHLSGFTIGSQIEKESLQLPALNNLKTLLLEECGVGTKFLVLTNILRNTPNLEKLGLYNCIVFVSLAKKRKRGQEARPHVLWCEKLKSIEIKCRLEDGPRNVKVLSEISKGMSSSRWRRVKISSTVV